MKKITFLTVSLLVLAAFILSACSASSILSDTSWKLVSFGQANNPTAAGTEPNPMITFDKDSKVSGSVGCNSLSGSFKVSGDKLVFGPIATTMMACDEKLMLQESTVLQVLGETAKFKLEDNKLTITSNTGDMVAIFEKVEP
jgi:heat shock protein HslJ